MNSLVVAAVLLFAIGCSVASTDTSQKVKEKRGITELGDHSADIQGESSDYESDYGHGNLEEVQEDGHSLGTGGVDQPHINTITQQVPVPIPQPYPVTVNRPVPVTVHQPYPVEVPRPYQVLVPVPQPVVVPRPVPVTVERRYPVPIPQIIHVPVPQPIQVPVPQPYPVTIPQPVPVRVPQPIVVPVPEPVQVGGGNVEGISGAAGFGGHSEGGYESAYSHQSIGVPQGHSTIINHDGHSHGATSFSSVSYGQSSSKY